MTGLRLWLWASILLTLALPARAQVYELALDADACAINFALTGAVAAGCAPPSESFVTRSAKPSEYSKDAAPLGSDSQNQGYFIRFAFNSKDLTPEYKAHLQRLGQVLTAPDLAALCVRLVGHTDAVGGQAFNLALSKRRAETVRGFLTSAAGVDAKRLSAVGIGKVAPLPGYAELHPLQRRVEILAKTPKDGKCS